MRSEHPFPYWLYSPDLLEYALGLLRSDVLQELPRRLGYLFAKRPARARPDGYWDYELNYAALGLDRDPAWTRLDLPSPANVLENTTGRFPAAERLRELASALSPRVQARGRVPADLRAATPEVRHDGRSRRGCV